MAKDKIRAPQDKMGLPDLLRDVSNRTGVPIKDVGLIVRATIASIKDYLFHNKCIYLTGLGIFFNELHKEKIHQMPDGSSIYTPKRLHPKFKFAIRFKKQIKHIKIDVPEYDYHMFNELYIDDEIEKE